MFSNMKRRYLYDPKDKNQSFTSILVALTKARIGEPGTHSTKAKGTQARFQSAEQQPILCVPESQSWQNGCQLAAFIRCQTASTKNNTSSYGFWYRVVQGEDSNKIRPKTFRQKSELAFVGLKTRKVKGGLCRKFSKFDAYFNTNSISILLDNPKPILIIRVIFLN